MSEELDLNSGFPDHTEQDWLAQLVASSGIQQADGQDAEARMRTVLQKLTHHSLDDIAVAPLYSRKRDSRNGSASCQASPGTDAAPGVFPFRRGTQVASQTMPWDIRQIFRHGNAQQANRSLLHELENGVTSVHLEVCEKPDPSGATQQIGINSSADFNRLLKDVYVDLATVSLQAGSATITMANHFFEFASQQGLPAEKLLGAINMDPLTDYAASGNPSPNSDSHSDSHSGPHAGADVEARLLESAALAKHTHHTYPGVTSIAVNTRLWHDAGANNVQELAIALANGLHYLRLMTDNGLTIEQANAQIIFNFALDCDYFTGIAKLRAARQLWAHVCQCCDAKAEARMQQHAFTSQRMLSAIETDVNQLRNTVACAAAGIGGSDVISVETHSIASTPDALARRRARNIQIVLQEESLLHKVCDPMGGSSYIENLTDELIKAAWSEFQKIEQAGGALESIRSGYLKQTVNATSTQRAEKIAKRKINLVGVNQFAHAATDTDLSQSHSVASTNLPTQRDSAAFEKLRHRSSLHSADPESAEIGNAAQEVFLATLGSPADYRARAGFAESLLATGAIAACMPEQTTFDIDGIVAAFRESGLTAAILCSSDALYTEQAVSCIEKLRIAGAVYVALAGSPDLLADQVNSEPSPTKIDDYIFLHCNAIEKLGALLDTLGVPRAQEGAA